MTELQPSLFGDPAELLGPVSRHPAYRAWSNMIQRCHNPENPGYAAYGGRGIVVCEEWQTSSRAFIAWALLNGWQPGLQLDRRDNDGPYSPVNARWVTRLVNANNKRNTVRLSDGTALQDVARRLGVKVTSLHMRLQRGMSPDEAVALPLMLPGQQARRHFLPDGTALVDVVLPVGLNAHAVRARVSRGWSLDDAVSIPKGGKRPAATAQAVQGESEASALDGGKQAQPASIGQSVASRVDERRLLQDYSHIPATAGLPCDAAQSGAACDLRAARAHLKGRINHA